MYNRGGRRGKGQSGFDSGSSWRGGSQSGPTPAQGATRGTGGFCRGFSSGPRPQAASGSRGQWNTVPVNHAAPNQQYSYQSTNQPYGQPNQSYGNGATTAAVQYQASNIHDTPFPNVNPSSTTTSGNGAPRVYELDDGDWDDTPPAQEYYSAPPDSYQPKQSRESHYSSGNQSSQGPKMTGDVSWDTQFSSHQQHSSSYKSNDRSDSYQTRKSFNDNWRSRNEDSRSSSYRSRGNNRSSYNFTDNTADEEPVKELDFKKLNEEAQEYRRQQLAKMTPLVKNLYIEDPTVANMSPSLVTAIRLEKNNIIVSLPDLDDTNKNSTESITIPNPVTTFEQCFKHYPEILREISKQDFNDPSPIQCQMWPCLLKGQDVVGIAQTGSGKTLAFLLPALLHIEKQTTPVEDRKSPTALVLAPTRELALQIEQEVRKYSYKGFKSVCIYGGGDRREQIAALERQVEIVIATPGRLNDLVAAGHLDLSGVSYLVLDEADEMLDQGFEPQINKALLSVRGDRQTCLTSATWPASVRRMAKNYSKNPILVVVGSLDLTTVNTVTQHVVFVDETEKLSWVQDFVVSHKDAKIIIFVGKKAMADHMSSEFCLSGIDCQCIHGDLSQYDREQAISDMKEDKCRVLIGTDVASRGIDIRDITHVINYDVPRTSEQYVHRVGRTGRAGRTGEAWTVMSRGDWGAAQELIEVLHRSEQQIPKELQDMAERFKNRKPRMDGGGRGRGGFGRSRW